VSELVPLGKFDHARGLNMRLLISPEERSFGLGSSLSAWPCLAGSRVRSVGRCLGEIRGGRLRSGAQLPRLRGHRHILACSSWPRLGCPGLDANETFLVRGSL